MATMTVLRLISTALQARTNKDTSTEKHACSQGYGHHVVAGGSDEVLDHLSVGGFAEQHQGSNVFRIAVNENDIGCFCCNVNTRAHGNSYIGSSQGRSIIDAVTS